ncbi:hypothetical protein [Streptomyces sp. NPDC050504]|uniref:hypothetical protein n=1 Tax=Streptomyces sp. NPDC050504 TaxID=3365618 RepID=UPI003787C22E
MVSTVVIGFRLGSDERGLQATALVTAQGVHHLAHGPYDQRPRYTPPGVPIGKNPIHNKVSELRKLHGLYLRRGYDRALIPPVCVRLDVDEHPLSDFPHGANRPRAHPELVEDFVRSAPTEPCDLEEAVRTFYTTVGLPARPRLTRTLPTQAPAPVLSRVQAMRHTLAHGEAVTSDERSPVGYRITADTVSLRVGTVSEDLDRRRAAELQAVLTAWLYFNRQPPPGTSTGGGPDGSRG